MCESVVDLFSCCTYMQLYQIANNRLAATSECVLEMNKNYSFCAKTLQLAKSRYTCVFEILLLP